jgi:hypothetical protein
MYFAKTSAHLVNYVLKYSKFETVELPCFFFLGAFPVKQIFKYFEKVGRLLVARYLLVMKMTRYGTQEQLI